MAQAAKKKRKYDRLFCDQCGIEVSKSTFYSHYNKFYDQKTGQWEKSKSLPSDPIPFKFSEDSNSESGDGCSDSFTFDDDERPLDDTPPVS